jgi:hypothetical protein
MRCGRAGDGSAAGAVDAVLAPQPGAKAGEGFRGARCLVADLEGGFALGEAVDVVGEKELALPGRESGEDLDEGEVSTRRLISPLSRS